MSEASGWRATCIFEPQPPSIPSRDLTPVTHFMGHKSKFDPRAKMSGLTSVGWDAEQLEGNRGVRTRRILLCKYAVKV